MVIKLNHDLGGVYNIEEQRKGSYKPLLVNFAHQKLIFPHSPRKWINVQCLHRIDQRTIRAGNVAGALKSSSKQDTLSCLECNLKMVIL